MSAPQEVKYCVLGTSKLELKRPFKMRGETSSRNFHKSSCPLFQHQENNPCQIATCFCTRAEQWAPSSVCWHQSWCFGLVSPEKQCQYYQMKNNLLVSVLKKRSIWFWVYSVFCAKVNSPQCHQSRPVWTYSGRWVCAPHPACCDCQHYRHMKGKEISNLLTATLTNDIRYRKNALKDHCKQMLVEIWDCK